MKIAIIGGYGKMGRWFASFLLEDGWEVLLIGRDERKLLKARQELGDVETISSVEGVKSADLILLSVPIDSFEVVVKELSPHVSANQVVIDITSIKEIPVKVMHKYLKEATTLGVHPMFGPGAKDIAGQNFVLTPTNEDERTLAEKVRRYLETRGARVTLMTPGEHDQMMAIVLGLSHLVAVVLADTLLSLKELRQTKEVSGSTYKVLLTLAESVVSEAPEFCASLQMGLPVAEIEERFQKKLASWVELVVSKDKQGFIQRMNGLRNRLKKDAPDFEQAYRNMYKLIEGL